MPGAAPFIRGGRAANDPYLPWDIRQVVSHPDPGIAADQVMEALEGGVSSIELRVDAAGEHGVVARSSVDIERVLKGVKLDLAPVALEAAGASTTQGMELAALLAAAVAVARWRTRWWRSTWTRSARWRVRAPCPVRPRKRWRRRLRSRATLRRVSEGERRCGLTARPVHEAGGTEVQELAYLVAAGAEYVRALMTAGLERRCGMPRDAVHGQRGRGLSGRDGEAARGAADVGRAWPRRSARQGRRRA